MRGIKGNEMKQMQTVRKRHFLVTAVCTETISYVNCIFPTDSQVILRLWLRDHRDVLNGSVGEI